MLSSGSTYRVGVIGASGYTGAEMLRLLASHPNLKLAIASGDSKAGTPIGDLYPSLAAFYGDRVFDTFSPDGVDGLDLVFCGLPHGVSMGVVPEIRGRVGHIVDLGSDFRLHDEALYPEWYGAEHSCPDLLDEFVYGLPDLFADSIRGAELIAATGCNAASAVLTLAPLVAAGVIDPSSLIADIITGASGAGRPPKESTTFCAVDENAVSYGLINHRHTPEIEQAIKDYSGEAATVLFTPHLVPMNRGILATTYGLAVGSPTTEDVIGILSDAYADNPFVVVSERSPATKATLGANTVHLTARMDPRTGRVMGIAALDNLMKGASGMAIQNANLALGLQETAGLPIVGVFP